MNFPVAFKSTVVKQWNKTGSPMKNIKTDIEGKEIKENLNNRIVQEVPNFSELKLLNL